MQRRDISGFLFGSVAGSMILPSAVSAQTCTPPCYAPIAAETGISPILSQYPPLDVRRYGAILDGVANDTTPLLKAITVASQLGGAEIFIPLGILRLTASVALPARVSLRGEGRMASRIKVDGAFTGITVATPDHDPVQSQVHTRILGVGFVGGPGATGALHFSRVNYILVRDCAFEGFVSTENFIPSGFGIQMTQCYIWAVEHCFFQNINAVGLRLVPASVVGSPELVGCNQGVFGPNNEVIGNNQPSFIGISVSTSQNVVIANNDFEGSGNGNKAIDLIGVEGAWICGNYIEQWSQAAIAANTGGASKRVFIAGNFVHATSANVCNFNNVTNPNSNFVVALNRFADLVATQTCVFVGTTQKFCEYNNDPSGGKFNEIYSPSSATVTALNASIAWNPPAIASGSAAAVIISVPGAVVGDLCLASLDNLGANNFLLSAHVMSANSVRVVLFNKEASAVDLPSGTLRVKVFK
jgi:hypothetical protein